MEMLDLSVFVCGFYLQRIPITTKKHRPNITAENNKTKSFIQIVKSNCSCKKQIELKKYFFKILFDLQEEKNKAVKEAVDLKQV